MFDVGFSEMMVIAVVALIVIGPEKLPKVARTLGHLVGRLQRYVGDVKADISREMELEELRKFKDEFQNGAQALEQTIHNEFQRAESDVRSVADQAITAVQEARPDHGSSQTGDPPRERAEPAEVTEGVAGESQRGVNQA